MTSKEFFDNNKEKIHETAKFLCSNKVSVVDAKFDELKKQYYGEEGTNHNEIVKINNQNIDVSHLLDSIRNKDIEHFIIYLITTNGTFVLYQVIGDQFKARVDVDEIKAKICTAVTVNRISNIGLFIVHNHPISTKHHLRLMI